MNHTPVYLNQLGLVCALGDNHDDIHRRFTTCEDSYLTTTAKHSPGHRLPLGVVTTPLPSLAGFPAHERTRTNQLLIAAMKQIKPAFDAARSHLDPLRIGIVLGTSTSGIAEGESAVAQSECLGELPEAFHYASQEMAAPADCLARWLDIDGPVYVVSTACSSSAKALASARRLLRMDICDLVIAGGVDSLCGLTVNGFLALESVSNEVCQPFSQSRNGINIGEGAALFLLSRETNPGGLGLEPSGSVQLSGVGETSDGHHISAPDPTGAGAAAAMLKALKDAELIADEIDYLNLHGTATTQNDRMESLAVAQVLGNKVACSSTKTFTGHTLGAAGAIEAAICWLTLTRDSTVLPLHRWDGKRDPDVAPINLVQPDAQKAVIRRTMSNSFAFGGNNISLVMELAR